MHNDSTQGESVFASCTKSTVQPGFLQYFSELHFLKSFYSDIMFLCSVERQIYYQVLKENVLKANKMQLFFKLFHVQCIIKPKHGHLFHLEFVVESGTAWSHCLEIPGPVAFY